MNRDIHHLYKQYKLIKENNVWNKIASMLRVDPENLTQDDADRAVYNQKIGIFRLRVGKQLKTILILELIPNTVILQLCYREEVLENRKVRRRLF